MADYKDAYVGVSEEDVAAQKAARKRNVEAYGSAFDQLDDEHYRDFLESKINQMNEAYDLYSRYRVELAMLREYDPGRYLSAITDRIRRVG